MNINDIIKEEFQHFINEKSIDSLHYYDIITPNYFKEIQQSDRIDRFIDLYKMEEGIDDDIDNEEIENSEDFQNWLKYEIEVNYDNVLDNMVSKIKSDGTIDIWREMTVDDKWVDDLIKTGKHLGIFWSWDERAAEAHGGKFSDNYKKIEIKSSVNEKYIDWEETIKLNMDIDLGEDEKEIRLFKNTPLKIEELIYDDKDLMNTSLGEKIRNKTFYA